MTNSEEEDLIQLNLLSIQGKYSKILSLLENYDENGRTLSPQHHLSCMLIKCKALLCLFKLEEASELIDLVIKENKKLKEDLIYIDALIIKAEILGQLGKIDNCKKTVDQAFNFVLSSPLKETSAFMQKLVLIYNYNGALNWLEGELNKALENYQKGFELGTKIQDKYSIAISLSNIGAIYWRIGNLTQALRIHEDSLPYFKDLSAEIEIAVVLGNIGEIYRQKGVLQKALDYHLQSLTNLKQLGNVWFISRELLYLVSLTLDIAVIEKTPFEKANEYLIELEKISNDADNKVINQRYLVAKALILKTSSRTRDKGRAEIIFQEIVNDETLDYEVSFEALLNLCDLHLMELHASNNPEILLEVQSLVNRLFEIAKKQPSYTLLSNAYLLKSKLALIQLDTKKAKNFLDQAQQICEKKGLKGLAISISNEYDVLLSQLTKWEEFIDRNAPLAERLEFTEFKTIVDQMLKKKMKELPKESKDDPVSILILEDRGTTIFSKHFSLDSDTMADDQIIGGFLTAINSFMQSTFSSTGYLERIKHKDYTLILKTKAPFTFCYVFKGQSYSAMKKLNRFITQVKESDSIWASFLRYVRSTILPSEPEKRALDTIAEMIFL